MQKTFYRKSQDNSPQAQLARAISRYETLKQTGVDLLEQLLIAHRRDNAKPVYFVPSQSLPNMYHHVEEVGGHLVCDCKYATEQHKVCTHRAVAFLYLSAEAKKASQQAQAERKERRETAILADHTPEEFSIYR